MPEGSQLVLGPWGGAGKTCFRATAQDCTAATTTPAAAVVSFLDCAIRGRCVAASPVAYFTTGSGAGWHTATAWPPVDRTTIRTLFLTPAALATATPTTGHIEFTVDAAATTGVRSRWNTARGLLGLPVVYTEGARAGHVGFDSAPLEVASTLVGSPALLLTLEPIDGTDIAIFAYLEEIAADGAVTYVSEGQLLASHPVISRVNGSAAGHPEPLCRNYTRSAQRSLVGPTVVEVVMQPVAHTFAVGSHMRLSLAGADADNFDTSKLDVASSWKIYIGESSIALAMQN
jgi:putative CocE/NonD family hydrolase